MAEAVEEQVDDDLAAFENPVEWGRLLAAHLVDRFAMAAIRAGKFTDADSIIEWLFDDKLEPVIIDSLSDEEIAEILHRGYVDHDNKVFVPDVDSLGPSERDAWIRSLSETLAQEVDEAFAQVADEKKNKVVPLFLRRAEEGSSLGEAVLPARNVSIPAELVDQTKERKELEKKFVNQEDGLRAALAGVGVTLPNGSGKSGRLGLRQVKTDKGDTRTVSQGRQEVLRGTYQGHDAAIKLVRELPGTAPLADIAARWKKVKEMRQNAPAKIRPFLPQVWLVQKVRDKENEEDILVIATEVLSQVTGQIKTNIFGPGAKEQENIAPARVTKRLLDIPFLKTLIMTWLGQVMDDAAADPRWSLPIPTEEQQKEISTIIAASIYGKTYEDLLEEDGWHECLDMLSDNIDPTLVPTMEVILREWWVSLPRVINLQPDIADSAELAGPVSEHASPESIGLRAALDWMKDKGLAWSDVLEGNVMQRSNGQLVLIDFDQYENA